MMGTHSDGSVTWYGVPVGLWIIFFAAISAAIVAVVVAWRSNVHNQRYLDEQLTRGWQQLVRQLKHEAEQRGKQRVHETEQLTKQLEHDADQKAKGLQHSLRQDIYVEAAAALLNLHTLISRTATVECNETLLWESFAENHARIVKVHMVATEPTVEVVMMYMNELAPAFVELTARRRQIRVIGRPGESALSVSRPRAPNYWLLRCLQSAAKWEGLLIRLAMSSCGKFKLARWNPSGNRTSKAYALLPPLISQT